MSHEAYRVLVGGEPRFFVKRADLIGSGGRELHDEAAVYRLADSEPRLASVMPMCHYISEDDSLIVLEALPDAQAIHTLGTVPVDASMMRSYGSAVAQIHAIRTGPFGEPPWLLVALEDGSAAGYGRPDAVGRFFTEIARRALFVDRFRAARRAWRAESLIHGDLRWSNVMAANAPRESGVRIVDWELASVGDPGWDFGSVLADVVLTRTLALNRQGPIGDVVDAFSPFAAAYLERVHDLDVGAIVHRGTLLAGVRLIQTISEYGHMSEAEMSAVEPLLVPWASDLLEHHDAIATRVLESVRP